MEAPRQLHFGTLLRQFRLDAGMTQQQLADRAKLSVQAVSTLERGSRTRPYRKTVALLARALELSPEREALLNGAAGVAHPPRRRDRAEAVNPSLLNVVRPDTHATRHNLSQQLTSFVGRKREVAATIALLREHRLVSIVGAGGVGKTRVAVQAGRDVLDRFPDGVWLVDQAPLADQSLVTSTILSALRLPTATGSPSDVITAYLKTRSLLLILDNCEHVIAAAGEIAASIVRSCPNVRVLTTSRQALDVPGERIYRLPSMAVPPDSRGSAQEVLRYGAAVLFVDRARAVNPGFSLLDSNAPHVADICRHLDGIPLAIELAAARVKVLTPRQIALRLDQRFQLLTGGDSRTLPRHQTMTALFDWSYDLLPVREQRFFESLSVFAGGCTLEAVTAVCATDGEDDIAVIDLITSLATKSLLVAELVANEQRYRLLESSRQYARNKLCMRSERPQIARRHAQFFADVAQQFDRAWDTTSDGECLPWARIELENWRAALEWALAKRHDVELGQRLAGYYQWIWHTFPLPEARRWVALAFESVDKTTAPILLARLEHSDASGLTMFGERKPSLAAAGRALARYRELADISGIAHAQHLAGLALVLLGRVAEAEPLLREALETARTLGNRRLLAIVLEAAAFACSEVGDFAGARAHLTEALRIVKLLGADLQNGSLTLSLAIIEDEAGDTEAALRLTAELLAAGAPSSKHVATALVNMAEYLIKLGRYDGARLRAKEALDVARELNIAVLVALALQHLASVAVLRTGGKARRGLAEYADAARLLGFVYDRRATLGVSVAAARQENSDASIVLRGAIGADELATLMAMGATMTEEEAIAQAQALE